MKRPWGCQFRQQGVLSLFSTAKHALDLTRMSGYVMVLATNLLKSPSQKKSMSVSLPALPAVPRRPSVQVRRRSKTMYWIAGLVTRIRPGITPLKSAPRPSSDTMSTRTAAEDLALSGDLALIVDMRVLSTQIGLVATAVITPARVRAGPAGNETKVLRAVVGLEPTCHSADDEVLQVCKGALGAARRAGQHFADDLVRVVEDALRHRHAGDPGREASRKSGDGVGQTELGRSRG